MSTSRYLSSHSSSDSDSEDYIDANATPIENEKIRRFYFDHNAESLEEVWAFQYFGGGIYHRDQNIMASDRLARLPNQDLILHQYDIPESDAAQQKKMYDLYEKTKSFNGDQNAFGATQEMLPHLIVQFKYYSGYWKYSRSDKTSGINVTFHACDPHEKQKLLINKEELAMQYNHFADELEKSKSNAKNNLKLCGLSLTLAIASYAFDSPYSFLACAFFASIQAALFKHNTDQSTSSQAELTKLKQSNALLVSSIFAAQKKTPHEANAATQRKSYG